MADIRPVRNAWRRGSGDPAFLERFTDAYEGAWTPLDALWWLSHPEDPSPSGEPSPAARAATQTASLYRRQQEQLTQFTAASVATDLWKQWALAQNAFAVATSESRRAVRFFALAIAVGLIVIASGGGLYLLATRPAPSAAITPLASLASPDRASPPAVALPDPNPMGDQVLRMSDASPRIGGEWRQSGTSAFQSRVVHSPRPMILTVSCIGGARLVIVAGQDGLNNGGFAAIDCPEASVATAVATLSGASTTQPFRIVAYEREPVRWKLVLSTYPG